MQVKDIFEFLIWDNCNNNCKFCFQRKNPRLFKPDEQKIILKNVLKFLKSDDYKKGSHVLIVGGEIFDQQREYLIPFFQEIVSMMVDDTIDILYLNTNLIYDHTYFTMLKPVLTMFNENNLFQRLKFTTSFDIEGRFRNKEDRSKCLKNLILLKENFPNLNTVVNIILTKQFCESVISGKFDLFDFMRGFGVNTNLIPYIVLDKSLCAPRDLIMQALLKINEKHPDYIQQYVENMDLRHKRFLYACYPNELKLCSCEDSDCGHSVNFKKYSDDPDACFVCDLKKVFNND